MEIFKDFGVNPVLLIAQIVNFLVILFILKKFMYKPVLDILKKRENQIKEGLKSAEESEKKLAQTLEKEKEILHKAHETAEKIVSDAKIEAGETKAKIEELTKKEVERMLNQSRRTIEQETKEAEQKLSIKIGQIAVTLLEKSLKGLFGEREQKLIMKKAVAQLEKQKI